jgi:hypothetical protein
MGVADRHSARFRHESDRIAKVPKQGDDDDELIFETETPAVATKVPLESLRARTATRHDPLTTELLAEVSRRSQTMEIPAETAEDAQEHEPEPVPANVVRKR